MTKSAGMSSARLLAQEQAEKNAAEARRAYEARQHAFDEKTARLRTLRLAKEAADRDAGQTAPAAPASAPSAARKPAPKPAPKTVKKTKRTTGDAGRS